MKEDILEQIVEGWLLSQGYFVQHNLKFKPRSTHPDYNAKLDSVPSDIDVIGYHPKKEGPDKVLVVSCKSYQNGFRPVSVLDAILKGKTINGRPAWKSFRELTKPKWTEGFFDTVERATGVTEFTYILAVTRLVGTRYMWTDARLFGEAMKGNPVKLITFQEMVEVLMEEMTTTPASTEVMRILQLLKAADLGLVREWKLPS